MNGIASIFVILRIIIAINICGVANNMWFVFEGYCKLVLAE